MKDEAAIPDPTTAHQEESSASSCHARPGTQAIRKIDDALKRIEDGSYGLLLEDGEKSASSA